MLPSQMSSQGLYGYTGNDAALFDPNGLAFDTSMANLGHMASLNTTGYLGSSSTLEPNSPELFRQNMSAALHHAEYLRRRIDTCIANIRQAYYARSNPQLSSADMKQLRDEVEAFVNHLVNSGIGALPLLYDPNDPNDIARHDAPRHKKEEELLPLMTSAVSTLYAKQKQIQDNNAVVANLLSAPDVAKR